MEQKLKIAGINNEALKAYRPFDELTLKSLRDNYRIGLTYSSNALEGNSLTEPETRVVIEDGLTIEGKPLKDVYEALNHAKAYDHLYRLLQKKQLKKLISSCFISCLYSKLTKPRLSGNCIAAQRGGGDCGGFWFF